MCIELVHVKVRLEQPSTVQVKIGAWIEGEALVYVAVKKPSVALSICTHF